MDKKSFLKGLFSGLGIALIGVFVTGGVLACSKKGTGQPVTTTPIVNNVDVRSGFKSNVRKAPDVEGGENLLSDVIWRTGRVEVNSNSQLFVGYDEWPEDNSYKMTWLNLPEGYYYFRSDPRNVGWVSGVLGRVKKGDSSETLSNAIRGYQESAMLSIAYYPINEDYPDTLLFGSDDSQYFYWSASDSAHYELVISGYFLFLPELYLVDTLDLPATSVISLGENWNPLKAFGDNLSPNGGYLIRNETWTYGSSTLPVITLSGMLFKYENQVFDRIQIVIYPLNSSHSPYVDSAGNIISPTESSGSQEIYVLQSVSFAQSWNTVGELPGTGLPILYSVPVLSATRADSPVNGKYPYNGSVAWASQGREIYVIDDKGTIGTRFDNRFLGMTDFELMVFLSEYGSTANGVNPAIDWLGSGYSPFILLADALAATGGFLSITILPGLSLGIMFTIPLILSLIIVVFKMIKK